MLPIFTVIYPYFIHEKIGYSKRKNWSLDYSQMSSEMLRSELRNDEKRDGERVRPIYIMVLCNNMIGYCTKFSLSFSLVQLNLRKSSWNLFS